MQAGSCSCSSDSTPSLGTSICRRYDRKKQKKKNKNKKLWQCLLTWNALTLSNGSSLITGYSSNLRRGLFLSLQTCFSPFLNTLNTINYLQTWLCRVVLVSTSLYQVWSSRLRIRNSQLKWYLLWGIFSDLRGELNTSFWAFILSVISLL